MIEAPEDTRGSSGGLPRRFRRAALAFLGIVAASAGPAVDADSTGELDMLGTWFVIIHYTDPSTANPDVTRWLDRVWTFEKQGSRLSWAEYPIVVVSDQTGRFEAARGNPRSRVLEGWEPNAGQREEILSGPRVNSRGSKKKSLRRTTAGDWRSSSRASSRSATTIGYAETWEIARPTGLPRFSILDALSSGITRTDQGGSIYAVTQIGAADDEMSGTYERDGVKHGTFRMLRTAPVRGLVTAEDERTPNQRAYEREMERLIDEAQKPEAEP